MLEDILSIRYKWGFLEEPGGEDIFLFVEFNKILRNFLENLFDEGVLDLVVLYVVNNQHFREELTERRRVGLHFWRLL